MTDISIQDFCAIAYCAQAACDAIPPAPGNRLAFEARSTEGGVGQRLFLEFEGVHDFRRQSARPQPEAPCEPNDLLELSVVELDGAPGRWRVWLNPWYLEEIEFWCARISLNGLEVSGEGRWLQDELPAHTPTLPAPVGRAV